MAQRRSWVLFIRFVPGDFAPIPSRYVTHPQYEDTALNNMDIYYVHHLRTKQIESTEEFGLGVRQGTECISIKYIYKWKERAQINGELENQQSQ